ncbi:ankyrin-1-like [Corticium candelabrum]|uniref:ankyrin-1-like n=1 Tax=Corticium candelabrum TaxID=121492 RepID=UPI002E2741C2|nr:ankyrin-1-like [Corticium candelabrum]
MSFSEDEELDKLLSKLNTRIRPDSLPDLKQQCSAVLSESLLDGLSTVEEVFSVLCRHELVSPYNWPQLVELMNGIGRSDLAKRVRLYGKRQGLPDRPEGEWQVEEEPDNALVTFKFASGCDLTESVSSLFSALNMLVFESGSSTIWFMGSTSFEAIFHMNISDAEKVMSVARQKPIWLLQLFMLHVQCGEDIVSIVVDPTPLELSLKSDVSLTLDPKFQRLIGSLVKRLSDRDEIIRCCSLVLDDDDFVDSLSLDEVFEELLCRHLLTPYNYVQLAELMRQAGRSDLAQMVERRSRRYGFMVSDNDGILPQCVEPGRVVVKFSVQGKQPLEEKISNMIDGFSMILFKTALPVLWYLACVAGESHQLYFVTTKKNLRRIFDSARNGHVWLQDLGIVTVTVGMETVSVVRKGPDTTAQKDRDKRLVLAAHQGNQNLVQTLLGLHADVHFQAKDQVTALMKACFNGNVEIVDLLINYGSNVNTCTEEEMVQPLHITVSRGHPKIAELLLNCGADINAVGWGGVTPLHIAAAEGPLSMVKLLSQWKGDKVDVCALDEDGNQPLHYSALEGHSDIVEFLLERGAPVNCRAKNNQAPLHWAAGNNRQDVVDILCDTGADPNCRDNCKCTPLHWATDAGNDTMAAKLLSRGSDVNAQNDSQQIALHWAGKDGHVTLSRVLLDNGSKVNLRDHNGLTPFQLCVSEGHAAVAKMMIAYGAEINEQNEHGCTVLHLAALNGYLKIANLLISQGCKVDKRTNDFYTPLHFASMAGHVKIAALLLTHGAEVNAIDDEGWNPLHVASFKNHPAVIEVLLQYKADIYAEDKRGRTAFHLAHLKNNQEVVDLFERKGIAVSVL